MAGPTRFFMTCDTFFASQVDRPRANRRPTSRDQMGHFQQSRSTFRYVWASLPGRGKEASATANEKSMADAKDFATRREAGVSNPLAIEGEKGRAGGKP